MSNPTRFLRRALCLGSLATVLACSDLGGGAGGDDEMADLDGAVAAMPDKHDAGPTAPGPVATSGTVACESDRRCVDLGLLCDLEHNLCVECVEDVDCSVETRCQGGTCQSISACDAGPDCMGAGDGPANGPADAGGDTDADAGAGNGADPAGSDDGGVDQPGTTPDGCLLGSAGVMMGDRTVTSNVGLAKFEGIREITGDLIIDAGDYAITTLSPMSCLATVGGDLVIERSTMLRTLQGLEGLVSVAGDVRLEYNQMLGTVESLAGLRAIEGDLTVIYNRAIRSLQGLEGVARVGGSLSIVDAAALPDLDGLDGIETVGVRLWIFSNDRLSNIDALGALRSVGTTADVSYNGALPQCAVDALLSRVEVGGTITDVANGDEDPRLCEP